MFSGTFNDLTVEQIAAMLSCLVFQDRRKEQEGGPQLRENLAGPYRMVQEVILNKYDRFAVTISLAYTDHPKPTTHVQL